MSLSIGMASFRSPDLVWATVTALKAYHPEARDCEIMVVANVRDEATSGFCKNAGVRYILEDGVTGTAHPRNQIFRHASCEWVLVIDDHVMLAPGALGRLIRLTESVPESSDLFQGPMMHDDQVGVSTHMSPRWQRNMWGVWATDPRGKDADGVPFEIPMQGLGLFCCRKAAWPGFNRHMKGFGGEEGYIHAKFKKRGNKSWCLPWLRWWHRTRPEGQRPEYPNLTEDRVSNYLLGFDEVGLDVAPIYGHFAGQLPDLVLKRMHQRAVELNRVR